MYLADSWTGLNNFSRNGFLEMIHTFYTLGTQKSLVLLVHISNLINWCTRMPASWSTKKLINTSLHLAKYVC